MKKKVLVIFLLIILLFNFISTISTAAITLENLQDEESAQKLVEGSNMLKDLDTGQAYVNSNNKTGGITAVITSILDIFKGGLLGTIVQIIITVANVIPQTVSYILSYAISEIEQISTNFGAWLMGNEGSTYTIYDTVMGNYNIFNFDFIHLNYEGVSAVKPLSFSVKAEVVKIYVFLRNVSIAALLFVLIYVGIKMATSTTALKKVKYKKMLTNWVVSFILVFFMHYILMILSYISATMLRLIQEFAVVIGLENLELDIMSGHVKDLSGKSGFNLITGVCTIWYLVYLQLKFFIMYVKRFCEISILVVISPLVTITYSIDKAKDNKAQAFNAWLEELIIKVSIQILHAMLYCLFMLSASVIAQKAPLIALIFFSGLSRAEKIFRNIFDVKDDMMQKTKIPIME